MLQTPYLNKGSAFSNEERKEFGLRGLLPPDVQTLDEQVKRAYAQYQNKSTNLGKNTFMTSMKEQNEVLYYKVSLSITDLRSHVHAQNLMNITVDSGEPQRDVSYHLHSH